MHEEALKKQDIEMEQHKFLVSICTIAYQCTNAVEYTHQTEITQCHHLDKHYTFRNKKLFELIRHRYSNNNYNNVHKFRDKLYFLMHAL